MRILPVPGFPGYFATSSGEIIGKRGRALSGTPSSVNRYVQVGLRCGARRIQGYAHIHICRAFHGPCPPGHEVDHVDRDKSNNRPSNLRWVTHLFNSRRQLPGSYSPDEVKSRLAAGERASRISRDLGISESTVSRIKNGSRWANTGT